MRPRPVTRTALATLAASLLCSCAGAVRYGTAPGDTAGGPTPEAPWEEGIASYYGTQYHGRTTASGEVFDMHAISAAHRTLPFDTWVRVTHVESGRAVEVRINDRGPFIRGRIIDLSFAAAEALGMVQEGIAKVRLEVLEWPGGQPPSAGGPSSPPPTSS